MFGIGEGREVLNLHVIVLSVDQSLVVLVEILEVAVSQSQLGNICWIHAHTSREVVQVKQNGVPLVVHSAVWVNFKKLFVVRFTLESAQAAKGVLIHAATFCHIHKL